MAAAIVLGISILVQYTAAFYALRLARITGMRMAWVFIAAAITLMGVRRSITMFRLITGDTALSPDPVAELVALTISVLILVGIYCVAPIILSIREDHDEAAKLARENAVMAELGRIINSSLHIDEVYERFSESLGALIPFDRIVIRLIDKERGVLTLSYVAGSYTDKEVLPEITPLSGTVAEMVMRSRSGMIVSEALLDVIVERYSVWPGADGASFRSRIVAPLISRNNVIGVLSLRMVQPNAYTQRDLELAEHVATRIASAITNSDLFERVQASNEQLRSLSNRIVEVQERERRYIANELHDEIGQTLTGLKLTLESSAKGLNGAASLHLSEAKNLVNELMTRVRELSLDTCGHRCSTI